MKKKVASVIGVIAFIMIAGNSYAQTMTDVISAIIKASETSKTNKVEAVGQLEAAIALCDKVGDSATGYKTKYSAFIPKWQNSNTKELLTTKKYSEASASAEKAIALATKYNIADELTNAKNLQSLVYYQQGVDLHLAKNSTGAIPHLTKALETAKKNNISEIADKSNSLLFTIYMANGISDNNAKNYDGAITNFNLAANADPSNAKAFYYKGLALKSKNDFAGMQTAMDKALELGAKSDTATASSARKNLASTFSSKATKAYTEKKYADAIDFAKTSLKYNPKNGLLYFISAFCNNESANYDAAIEAANAGIAVETKPETLSDLYFMIGTAYQKKKDVANACASFKKVTAGANKAAAVSKRTELKCK